MKRNYKKRLRSMATRDVAKTSEVIKCLLELEMLRTLHNELGFGKKRLKRFADALNENYEEFSERAQVTDKYDRKHEEMTNIDEAIIRVIRELRMDGIDRREMFGDDGDIIIVDENGKETNLDEFVDHLMKLEGMNG